MTTAEITTMQEEIRALAQEREAVILAHNYQVPEVQDVADFVGDSLGLSREAASTGAGSIVFCGVHFMAETAAILSPDKTVLIPDLDAGCSLAASITADQLRAWKAENPGAVVVSYVNTTAEVKAESDYCCTSGNAKAIIESIPADTEILFLPDMYLGLWLEKVTGRTLRIWMGECHVHAGIRPRDIVTPASLRNALTVAIAMGGSTNVALHSVEIARAAGIDLWKDVLSQKEFNALSRRVPVLVNARPFGVYSMVDVDAKGGLQVIVKELLDAGLLEEGEQRISLTLRGRLLSNELFARLV